MLFFMRRASSPAGVFAALATAAPFGFGFVSAARADVTLPALISDNMIVQQKMPVHIYGTASPAEKVKVSLAGKSATATTGADGNWEVSLPPVKAGGPYTLSVQGNNTLTINNVLSGEVWVCSGQSNMELALTRASNGADAIAASANPNIHLFHVAKARSDSPAADVKAKWQECGPQTVPNFSAVGYFFGRDLQKAEGVPIGLIESDWGGTPAESWTSEEKLQSSPVLRPMIDKYPAQKEAFDKTLSSFADMEAKAKAEGKPAPRRPNAPWRYSELYNAMIVPLTKYPIRGATWYQGESNTGRAEQYRTLMPALIENWRSAWGIKDFPFLIVQLAPFGSGNSGGTAYAELREAQNMTAQMLPNVGVAVITDVGNEKDIHPTRKEPVGQRLALLARKIAYNEKVNAAGPTYKDMTVDGDKITVHFANVGDGLMMKAGETSGEMVAPGVLSGFTIAGADGKFVPANAVLKGKDAVIVSAQGVTNPTAVRFGFVNFPVVNLWGNDLPANPFRTDAPPVPVK